MARKLTQGEKLRRSMIKRLGSEEAYSEWMFNRSSKGGKAKVPKGFAINRELAGTAGRIGGSKKRVSS